MGNEALNKKIYLVEGEDYTVEAGLGGNVNVLFTPKCCNTFVYSNYAYNLYIEYNPCGYDYVENIINGEDYNIKPNDEIGNFCITMDDWSVNGEEKDSSIVFLSQYEGYSNTEHIKVEVPNPIYNMKSYGNSAKINTFIIANSNGEAGKLSYNTLDVGEKYEVDLTYPTGLTEGVYKETLTLNKVLSREDNLRKNIVVIFEVKKPYSVYMDSDCIDIKAGESAALEPHIDEERDSFTYKWYENDSQTPFATTKAVTVTPDKTTNYRLAVYDGLQEKEVNVTVNVTSATNETEVTGPESEQTNKGLPSTKDEVPYTLLFMILAASGSYIGVFAANKKRKKISR